MKLIENKPNNGIIKELLSKSSDFLDNLSNNNNNNNNNSEGTVLKSYLNCQQTNEKLSKTSDNPEIVTIDSDEEEPKVSTARMESLVSKNINVSKYCQSLPQPKLSLNLGSEDKKWITNGLNGFDFELVVSPQKRVRL